MRVVTFLLFFLPLGCCDRDCSFARENKRGKGQTKKIARPPVLEQKVTGQTRDVYQESHIRWDSLRKKKGIKSPPPYKSIILFTHFFGVLFSSPAVPYQWVKTNTRACKTQKKERAIQRPRTRSAAARQVSNAHERDIVTKIPTATGTGLGKGLSKRYVI